MSSKYNTNAFFLKLGNLCLFLIIVCGNNLLFAQKEAWNWYFGDYAGVNFSTGIPVALSNSAMHASFGNGVISDSTGSLLFYTDGIQVWNRNHQQMPNGYGLLSSNGSTGSMSYQTGLIIPKPDDPEIYYIFTVDNHFQYPYTKAGICYSVVDMGLNNGLGDIITNKKNIPLPYGLQAYGRIAATFHKNRHDIWIVSRLYDDDRYIAYLLTQNGIETPVLSSTGNNYPSNTANDGCIKITPDGTGFMNINVGSKNERCTFNNETGHVEFLYWFYNFGDNLGAEFSPDSQLFYTKGSVVWDTYIYQLDFTILDKTDFINSAIQLGLASPDKTGSGMMQLGPDGKIYSCQLEEPYLAVINKPNDRGLACDLQLNAVDLAGRNCLNSLSSFIQSYFLRFDYIGACAGSPFTFTPNFNPEPDSIHWNFGDPASGTNDTTTQLSPVHVFAQGGSYTVSVFVRYPDGRTEQTSRIVTVAGLPSPNLGPDITVCKGTSVTLNPGSFASYTWSNGTLGPTITVADSGQYWVEVVNDTGCINRDTLQLQWFAQPSLDETNLTVAPTTCNQSTGAITGLQVNALQPYTLTWKNGSGSILGTTPDLYHLPVDNYTLWVSDSAGCNTPVKTFTIHNVGDTLILSVDNSAAHCARPDGSIQINATSGLTDMLQYSLNGTDWFSNGGLFSQVAPGSYQVWVKDSLGCKKVYDGNPVVISNIPGPVVQPPTVVPETGGQGNGSISITATSAGDTVWYSINGGTPQPDNGFVQQPVSRQLFSHSS